MTHDRRLFLSGLLALAASGARAQSSSPPSGVLHLVVPFAPGGGNDVFARQMARGLGELRGQTIVVDNRPGAGGTVGSEHVVHSGSDTLLLGHTGTISINPALYQHLRFDPRTDLVPVAMFATTPLVLVVPATSPARSVAELLALARTRPGGLDYASSGSGTGGHLTGELFKQLGGVSLTHVPYKGTSPALTDLIGGQVQMMFSVLPPAIALVRAGKLRALAVTSSARLANLSDVPTVAESRIAALANFESSLTYGILAPKRTPGAFVAELSRQILAVAATPSFRLGLDGEGAVPLLGDGNAYAALIARESSKWAEIVKSSGAVAD
ncbi:MAG TPA: tripartite tricarboxylate transporter substrate binding protein [Burkholderiaceae bacterium]|jgi:tripartite-type tricarboxylate transporter receptor subunit TctC